MCLFVQADWELARFGSYRREFFCSITQQHLNSFVQYNICTMGFWHVDKQTNQKTQQVEHI